MESEDSQDGAFYLSKLNLPKDQKRMTPREVSERVQEILRETLPQFFSQPPLVSTKDAVRGDIYLTAYGIAWLEMGPLAERVLFETFRPLRDLPKEPAAKEPPQGILTVYGEGGRHRRR